MILLISIENYLKMYLALSIPDSTNFASKNCGIDLDFYCLMNDNF